MGLIGRTHALRHDELASAVQTLQAAAVLGCVLLDVGDDSDKAHEVLAHAPLGLARCYVHAHGVDTAEAAIKLLDAGAAKVVVAAKMARETAENLPWDRVIVAIHVRDDAPPLQPPHLQTSVAPETVAPTQIVDLMATAALVTGGIMLVFPDDAHVEVSHLIDAKKSLRAQSELLVAGAASFMHHEALSALGRAGISVVLDYKTLERAVAPAHVDLAGALTAPLTTDRPDGLFTTIVVDEQEVALGLVYSSVESVREALRTRRGVYQSRKNGLWYKGATSGATQDLLRIDIDCDHDALKFVVRQHGAGFCHLDTRTCFGPAQGLSALQQTLQDRKISAPPGSYTKRLFEDPVLLRAKIIEEANELCDAKTPAEVAAEAADLLYFAMTKCVAAGVTLSDVEHVLNQRTLKVTRRPGNAKPQYTNGTTLPQAVSAPTPAPLQAPASAPARIRMPVHESKCLTPAEYNKLLKRPIVESADIMGRVRPIQEAVKTRGDAALLELTERFDRVKLTSPIKDLRDPNRKPVELDPEIKAAIDLAMSNVRRFHEAQLPTNDLKMETMPGIECSRFVRPIERVGLYVPGGSAILPSTTYMLGVPAHVAGCKQIIVASPPGPSGNIAPEVEYIAEQIGATHIVLAGGAQAIFAMAYGTDSVPKVDKICGPGNQYVTAAKMLVQNDSGAMVSIDMPAGPSEVLVVADASANPVYVAADLLSQAEHGPDSQVVLLTVGLSDEQIAHIADEVEKQGEALPRSAIIRESIPKSFCLRCDSLDEAIAFSNAYAPEHLIVNIEDPEQVIPKVTNAGSVFLGAYSSERRVNIHSRLSSDVSFLIILSCL